MSKETSPIPQRLELQQVDIAETFMHAPVYAYGEIVRARPADFCVAFVRTVHGDCVESDLVLTGPKDWLVVSGRNLSVATEEEFRQYRLLPDGRYMKVHYLLRAFQNPLGVPVMIRNQASQDVSGTADCMFAMRMPNDARGTLSFNGFIEPDQFEATCRPYQDVFGRPFGQRNARERLATRVRAVRGLRWLSERILPS